MKLFLFMALPYILENKLLYFISLFVRGGKAVRSNAVGRISLCLELLHPCTRDILILYGE